MTTSRATGVAFLAALLLLSIHPCALAGRQSASPPAANAAPTPDQKTGKSLAPALQVDQTDADSLLRAAVPRTMRNRRLAMAYTYAIDYRNRNFTADGKPLTDYIAKYEVIFVGDLPYRRQIEENHQPLSGQAAAEEARRYERAFAERSQMSWEQKRDYLRRPWNVDVPLPQLTELFVNRVVGEQAVAGRPAIVLECLPRPGAQPADEEQRRALNKRVKLWVDREDLVASRIEATLIAEDAQMKPGTTARIDFFRKDGLWLTAQTDVRFETTAGSQLVRGETTERNDDFERFHVDVRLLDPAQTAGASPQTQ